MRPIDEASERIECEALRSLHDHCPANTRAVLGLALDDVDGALVASAAGDGSILLNRTLGLGVDAKLGKATLERVQECYQRRGTPNYFCHVYSDSLEEKVTPEALGMIRARGWRKFDRGTEASPKAKTELRVERIGAAAALDFGHIVAPAFGIGPAGAPLLAGLLQDPRWHIYVSYEGVQPAGAGALFIDGKYGWLEWGATHPDYRRRGSQGAVMAARLGVAIEAGCERIFTETGEAVEGDPQHSYGNIMRYGFVEGPLRENWKPAGS